MLLDITGGGGRGEVREDEETEREVDEEEVWGSRRSPHSVNLLQLARRRQKLCCWTLIGRHDVLVKNSASCRPLPVFFFCSFLLFIPLFLLLFVVFCIFLPLPLLLPHFLPRPLLLLPLPLPSLLLSLLLLLPFPIHVFLPLLHFNCPSSSPL